MCVTLRSLGYLIGVAILSVSDEAARFAVNGMVNLAHLLHFTEVVKDRNNNSEVEGSGNESLVCTATARMQKHCDICPGNPD